VIAQALGHLRLVVFFVLADGEDLRGAGLAGDLVGRAGLHADRGAPGLTTPIMPSMMVSQ